VLDHMSISDISVPIRNTAQDIKKMQFI